MWSPKDLEHPAARLHRNTCSLLMTLTQHQKLEVFPSWIFFPHSSYFNLSCYLQNLNSCVSFMFSKAYLYNFDPGVKEIFVKACHIIWVLCSTFTFQHFCIKYNSIYSNTPLFLYKSWIFWRDLPKITNVKKMCVKERLDFILYLQSNINFNICCTMWRCIIIYFDVFHFKF